METCHTSTVQREVGFDTGLERPPIMHNAQIACHVINRLKTEHSIVHDRHDIGWWMSTTLSTHA